MNLIVTKNGSLNARTATYSAIEFGRTSFSSIEGLETRTEKVAIQRFASTQPSNRLINNSIGINLVRPVTSIKY